MVAKFQDLNNQRRLIALSNDARKVWAAVLFLSTQEYSYVKFFFSAIFAGPQFVEVQKFSYHGNVL